MIEIKIAKKIATIEGSPVIVCGNSDYLVHFDFDEEWADKTCKTARFAFNKGGLIRYLDVIFTGDTVTVPVLADITEVFVGVFSGNLATTTPASIPCELSIRCGTGAPITPTPDQYDQIMALMEDMAKTTASQAQALSELSESLSDIQKDMDKDIMGASHTIDNKATHPHVEGMNNKIQPVAGYADNNLKSNHVEGEGNLAASNICHAEGLNTKALGSVSHSEGVSTEASGTHSHAEGIGSKASGAFSHAQNCYTTASGDRSHAEGNRATASGESSHAGGEYSTASGKRAFAHGYYVTAAHENQVALGKYNRNRSNNIFEIGNGSASFRTNAFEVTKTGQGFLNNCMVPTVLDAAGQVYFHIGDTYPPNTSAGDTVVWIKYDGSVSIL